MKRTILLLILFLMTFTGEVRSVDFDGDGIPDSNDNCPQNYNPGQTDIDIDGIGDICDSCPFSSGTDQTNSEENVNGNYIIDFNDLAVLSNIWLSSNSSIVTVGAGLVNAIILPKEITMHWAICT